MSSPTSLASRARRCQPVSSEIEAKRRRLSTLRSRPKLPQLAPGMLGRMRTQLRTHPAPVVDAIRDGLTIPMIWLGRAISRRRLLALDAR